MRARHRGTDWPRLDEELSNALEDAYLRGVEEGERRMKKKMGEFIVLPPAKAYELHELKEKYGTL